MVLTRAAQSVYPTATTIYDPDRAWNGYTVFSPLAGQAVLVIQMNKNIAKRREGYNSPAGGPARVLPRGFVVAASGARLPNQESLELIQRDFDGKVVWRFSRDEQIRTREGSTIWQPSGRPLTTTTGSGRAFQPGATHRTPRQRLKAVTR